MNIALVSPIMIPVPPPRYGGIERVLDYLAHGLARRGHTVTVFCSGGSTISGEGITRVETSPYPTIPDHQDETRAWEVRQFLTVLAQQHRHDLVHFMYEPVVLRLATADGSINILQHMTVPATLAFRNLTDIPEHQSYYQHATWLHDVPAVFISEKQRSHLPWLTNVQVIPNGLPVGEYPFEPKKERFLLFLGRITREKGILEAIEVAKQTHTPLVIVARIDRADRRFYEYEVAPRIDGVQVRYVGELGFAEKVDLLKRASCLLFPILWEEAFGNVMIEALACGTPVVAFRRGAVPEVIQDGVTGFVVDTVDEMAAATLRIAEINPHTCRTSVEQQYSVDVMVDRYELLFRKVLR